MLIWKDLGSAQVKIEARAIGDEAGNRSECIVGQREKRKRKKKYTKGAAQKVGAINIKVSLDRSPQSGQPCRASQITRATDS